MRILMIEPVAIDPWTPLSHSDGRGAGGEGLHTQFDLINSGIAAAKNYRIQTSYLKHV
jgi:hypothetical protein